METTEQKAILYDDGCPMCALYTKGFVQWGVLRPGDRVPFSRVGEQLPARAFEQRVDAYRARHEIPLLDLNGGPTLYGVDAMLYLLSRRMPCFRYFSRLKPLYAFARFLYGLISYNRRIIIPSSNRVPLYDCTPDFHPGFRTAFLAYAVLLASGITYAFGLSVAHYWPFAAAGGNMLLVCGTGWVVQMLLAGLWLSGRMRMNYLGHLAVLMILGTLVLVPGMLLSLLTHYQWPAVPVLSVVLSSTLMAWQHYRRVAHLSLPQRWTVLWFLSLQLTAAGWLYAFVR